MAVIASAARNVQEVGFAMQKQNFPDHHLSRTLEQVT